MFCATKLVFGGTEGVGSCFHVLRSRTRFRWCGGRRVLFSCFALSDSFSTVPRASCTVFKFCSPGHFFGSTDGVGFRFHILRSPSHFRRYQGRRVPFTCFARPNSFSAILTVSGLVFMFCAPGLIFDGSEGVASGCQVLRSRTLFRRYRGCRHPISWVKRPYSFFTVPSASGPVFMYCAPALVLGGIEGVGSRFHILRSRTRFRRY
jgi:hypothetical protein